jgi:hypothetical protein
MLPPMDGLNDDLFPGDPEVDRVRKAREDRSPGFLVRSREGEWIRTDAGDERVHREAELLAEPGTSAFVPAVHLKRFSFGLRPENNPPRHV